MFFLLISLISVIVIIAIICLLFYQQYQIKTQLNIQLHDIVSQINNASLYAFNYDKTQNDNIQNVDMNVNSLTDTIKTLTNNVKAIEIKTSDIDEIKHSIDKAKTYVEVGKHILASKDDKWLYIQPNIYNVNKSVGLLTDSIEVKSSSILKNNTQADNITINSSLKVKGGDSSSNPLKLQTFFPYSDGINYIRGDTEISGNTKINGDIKLINGQKVCIGDTCITEENLKNMIKLSQYTLENE